MPGSSPTVGVCVIGSANLDLVAHAARHPLPGETLLGTEYHEFPGGKGLNQAVAAARAGAPTQLIASVGDDDAGRRLLAVARDEAIDVEAVHIDGTLPTGRAMIIVDKAGENSIVVIPGSNDRCPAATSATQRVVLAQLEVPIDTVLRSFDTAKSAGAATILNPAPATDLPSDLLERCDIIVPNEHEVELLGGVAHLHNAGVRTVIVTLGAHGVLISVDGSETRLPAYPVTPVDTTGAGDAFCGNLAAGIAAGMSTIDASRRAVVAGALATTKHGAVPSLPTAAAVDAALRVGS